jgi:hypothetical protein
MTALRRIAALILALHPLFGWCQPANDNFTDRIAMAGLTNQVSSDATGATLEPGESTPFPSLPWGSVWFSWIAPTNGWLTLESFAPEAEVGEIVCYTGQSIESLDRIQPQWFPGDQRAIEVAFGQEYDFALFNSGQFSFRWTLYPSPPNDGFEHRIVLSGESNQISGTMDYILDDPREPADCLFWGGAVWYAWVAPEDGSLFVSFPGSSCEMRAFVYQGNAVEELVRSESRPAIWPAPFEWHIKAGEEYAIAVCGGGGWECRTPFTMEWRLFSSPPNDRFSNRLTLGDVSNSVTGTLNSAWLEPGEGQILGLPDDSGSVWYGWVAPFDGVAEFVAATMMPSWIEVTVGSAISNLTIVDGSTSMLETTQRLNVTAGQEYCVAVWGGQYFPDIPKDFQLTVQAWPRGDNDAFTNRLALGGTNITISGNLILATAEPGESSHAGIEPRRSVWYEWRSPQNLGVTMTVQGEGPSPLVNPILAVYRGQELSELVSAAEQFSEGGRASVQFGAVSNEVYVIAVDSFSAGDDFRLQLDAEAPPSLSLGVVDRHGNRSLTVTGCAGFPLSIEISTNLLGWEPIAAFINLTGSCTLTIAAETAIPQRFYRIRLLP